MSKKRRERRKKKKSRDGRRRAQKIDVLRGEEGKEGCPSATMVVPGSTASHILEQGRNVSGRQSKCLMHTGCYHT